MLNKTLGMKVKNTTQQE